MDGSAAPTAGGPSPGEASPGGTPPRRRWPRVVAITVGTLVGVTVLLAALDQADLLTVGFSDGTDSMAPTIPGCDGIQLAEGLSYRFRDPHRGEIVVIHSRGRIGGTYRPDPGSRELALVKRVIGVPGDVVEVRNTQVFVNGVAPDEISTGSFETVRLGPGEYFVLGDNRDVSVDSRVFGPVPRAAIFARTFLVVWPLDQAGVPGYPRALDPPGRLCLG